MRKSIFVFFISLLVVYSHVFSAEAKKEKILPYYVMGSPNFKPYPPGLFCMFSAVLGFLNYYEKVPCSGIKVDFEEKGIYYDPERGPNWWEYYFEPINFGQVSKKEIHIQDAQIADFGYRFLDQPRKKGYELIQKYIKVKPHIQYKVEDFVQNEFGSSFIIGIHYRGTDKSTEAPRVPYEKVYEAISEVMNEIPNDCKIFVATDEQAFLEDICQMYPGMVIFTPSYRSENGKPVHLDKLLNNYIKGEDAVIDCLLLSRCHFLIRTVSYLSAVSAFFNPDVPVITLNSLYKIKN